MRAHSPFRTIAAVMYREYKIRVTSFTWLFYDLALPAFYLLLFGIGLNTAFSGGVRVHDSALSYNSFFLAGVLSMAGFGIAINTSYGFFVDRDNGIFSEFLTYPMTRSEFLLGKILFSMCITTVQALTTVLIGVAVLDVPLHAAWLPMLFAANAFCTAGWFFFLSIFALRIRRNDVYNTIINVSYFVLMFASSIFFPLDNSPAWLRIAAYANPLTWHTDLLRYFTVGAGAFETVLLECVGFALFAAIAFVVGVRSLRSAG